MYCYVIAPARDSNRSHGIHSPLRRPNSQCTSLLPIMLLFCSFSLSLHMHYVIVPICFPLSRASIVHGPLYLVS